MPGQEGVVRDQKKAHEMAKIEDPHRTNAKMYEEFSKINDPERLPEFFEQHKQEFSGYFEHYGKNASKVLTQIMEEHKQSGITPEYLSRIGELKAEQFGAVKDWKKQIRGLSDEELQKLSDKLFEDIYPDDSMGPRVDESRLMFNTTDTPEHINAKVKDAVDWAKYDAVMEESRRRRVAASKREQK